MAIKSGELIHVGNQVVVHRAQTAGPGTVNVPTTKIYELGNYNSVATIRDTADLTFTMESFDSSAAMECLLTGQDFAALPNQTEIALANVLPMDMASQFKAGRTAANKFDTVASVAMPFLSVESVAYRFGIADNASQTVTLRGDSIFYTDHTSAYVEEFAPAGPFLLAHDAVPYRGDTINGVVDADGKRVRYALGVSLKSGKRLAYGAGYTETVTGTNPDGSRTVTIVPTAPVPAGDKLRVVYQSQDVHVYPQLTHVLASATRPAAIKGRNIEVRVGGQDITDRWSSIQAVTLEQRLTLQKDEELGNAEAVANDFDVPVVTGTVDIKPRDVHELMLRIRQIAGITNAVEAVGPYQSVLLPLEVILHSPDTGEVLKTLYVPDARFTLPAFSGRVEQKLTTTFNWESDGGICLVYKGAKP